MDGITNSPAMAEEPAGPVNVNQELVDRLQQYQAQARQDRWYSIWFLGFIQGLLAGSILFVCLAKLAPWFDKLLR